MRKHPIYMTTTQYKKVDNIQLKIEEPVYSECKCCNHSYKANDNDIGICFRCETAMNKERIYER
jgi:Zn finger protein HypA/HybF involved in hydrogenase expression